MQLARHFKKKIEACKQSIYQLQSASDDKVVAEFNKAKQ